MGKFGKILLGAGIGLAAVAAAPFTGGGSIAAGTALGASLGIGSTITAVGLGAAAGAAAGTMAEKDKENAVKKAKATGFEDGVKKGRSDTVDEIKKYVDFYLATVALSYYIARCDGSISYEEQMEIDYDLDAIQKNKDIPDAIKKELYDISQNVSISFEDVKSYLDNVSNETLTGLRDDIDEIAVASNGINDDERKAIQKFDNYLKKRISVKKENAYE